MQRCSVEGRTCICMSSPGPQKTPTAARDDIPCLSLEKVKGNVSLKGFDLNDADQNIIIKIARSSLARWGTTSSSRNNRHLQGTVLLHQAGLCSCELTKTHAHVTNEQAFKGFTAENPPNKHGNERNCNGKMRRLAVPTESGVIS